MTSSGHPEDFEAIKSRLEEIVEAVGDESIPLDDALDLYEEAVELGMRISDVLEDGIEVEEEAPDGQIAEDAAGEAFEASAISTTESADR